MDAFHTILLQVWREACRHIELTASTATLAPLLRRHLPISQLWIRRYEVHRGCLETVAKGFPSLDTSSLDEARRLSNTQQVQLEQWLRQNRLLLSEKDEDHLLDFLAPQEAHSPLLAGALRLQGKLIGVLVLEGSPGAVFSEKHQEMARILLEPFSTALQNNHHVQEIARLQAAAEADRQSLLHRLGRRELGDPIIGAESGLRTVMERITLVAPSDAPVLILGETGTGKELIARAIHRQSPRSSGPIIRVNCGAIPSELIDSQLFGHEAGAFTGAGATHRGWFERADGGTLFLDEIGELPPAAQVRLLRILQDGWFERVGGRKAIHVDVRIVAATHRDLASMVVENAFREDLWYRIAVFPILLPPLRERLQDIPMLARHFAKKAAIRYGLAELLPGKQDLDLLSAYHWPGNVRELASVLDRAAILGNGRRLEIAPALGAATPPTPVHRPAAPKASAGLESDNLLPLDVVVKEHIETALRRSKGRIEGPQGAARVLQVNPHTLRARMKKLGIDWKAYRRQK